MILFMPIPNNARASAEPRALPAGYYLEHFTTMLDIVAARYGDLLTDSEREFLSNFAALSLPARRLYVRLSSRRGPAFRSDRIEYSEIGPIDPPANELATRNLLTINATEYLADAFVLLTVAELKTLAAEHTLKLSNHARKDALAEAILAALTPEQLSTALRRRFQWFAPMCQDALRVFRLLFFGTDTPDLSAFVLHDLGMMRFEPYPLESTLRSFATRSEIDAALALRDLGDVLFVLLSEPVPDETTRAHEVLRLFAALPPDSSQPLLLRRRRRFLAEIGRYWERQGETARALAAYSDPATFPARDRRARLLAKHGDVPAATELCEQILAAPRDPAEEEAAESLRRRLMSERKRYLRPVPPTTCITLPGPTAERVEARALAAMHALGWQGFAAENRFWMAMFGLVMWHEIFAPVPRAFGHPFQMAPNDLFSAEFRPAREEAVVRRLERLRTADPLTPAGGVVARPGWREEILTVYDTRHGTANALVDWTAVSRDQVAAALQVVPPAHLAAICERISRNPGGFCSGFPDLFLWRADGDLASPSASRTYLLAEVKSPGDRVQDNQRSWFRFFASHGIPHCVTQVQYNTREDAAADAEP